MIQLLLILHSGIAASGKIKRISQIQLLIDISSKHSSKNQFVQLQPSYSSISHYMIVFLSMSLLMMPSIFWVKMRLFRLLISMHIQNVYNHIRDILILSILILILIGDDPAAIVGLDEGHSSLIW